MHSKELCSISVIFLSLKDVSLSISTNLTAYLQKIKMKFKPKHYLKQYYVFKKICT